MVTIKRMVEIELARKVTFESNPKQYFPKFCSLREHTLARDCWKLAKSTLGTTKESETSPSLLTKGFLTRINKTVGHKVMTYGVKKRVKGKRGENPFAPIG